VIPSGYHQLLLPQGTSLFSVPPYFSLQPSVACVMGIRFLFVNLPTVNHRALYPRGWLVPALSISQRLPKVSSPRKLRNHNSTLIPALHLPSCGMEPDAERRPHGSNRTALPFVDASPTREGGELGEQGVAVGAVWGVGVKFAQ
jgi:hypothetical protein